MKRMHNDTHSARWTTLFLVVIVASIFCSFTLAQLSNINILTARTKYLGQMDPGLTPSVFASDIISSKDNREYILRFFPDGETCIFDRYGPDYPRGVILTTKHENGNWVDPYVNTMCCEYGSFEPGISPDGNSIFFTSAKLPNPRKKDGFLNMYYVKKTSSEWSEPVFFGEGIHPTITENGTVFYSRRYSDGYHVVFRIPKNNGYSKEYRWGKEFNMPFQESHPAISPDGSYIIFDSEGWKHDGDCKLFVSFRNEDGDWTFPKNMNKMINRNASKPWISADGKYIFFSSEGDIYWVNSAIVDEFKVAAL